VGLQSYVLLRNAFNFRLFWTSNSANNRRHRATAARLATVFQQRQPDVFEHRVRPIEALDVGHPYLDGAEAT
jgi:hypothetical protein